MSLRSTRLARQLTRVPSNVTLLRALSTSIPIKAPNNQSKMSGPPEKKMKHLQAINALPSQYPDFRTVLWTGESSQLVVMTIPVGGDIGEEVSLVCV
jgi:hypothetical protein